MTANRASEVVVTSNNAEILAKETNKILGFLAQKSRGLGFLFNKPPTVGVHIGKKGAEPVVRK